MDKIRITKDENGAVLKSVRTVKSIRFISDVRTADSNFL